MKKKILHIVEAFGGGIFSFLVDLINNTSDEYEIVVAYAMREQTPEDFEEKFSSNVRFIRVQNFVRSISIKKDVQAFWEIKKIIKEEKPQIIHLHSSKAGFLGRMATIGNKAKVLYNPHGFSFLMQNCSKIKRCLYWLIEKIGTLKNATIIGCSQGEYKEALKLSKKSICINNGINTKEIDFENLVFCTSGRVGYQKNPRLFNDIAKKFPNNKFVWIGDGELRNELNSPNIEITGWKARDEVLNLVNQCDVFLLTSLWEGLPISLLEAMYLEKICCVTNCIGNRDVIIDKKNGYILSENIDKFLVDRENAVRIKKEARNSVYDKYNLEGLIEKYRRVYE